MKCAIPYYRVSSERQGHSGLGLEAQRKSVNDFALSHDMFLLQEYTEIESGIKSTRPILLQAIERCKLESAILLIAKLDRLGRNVAFISALMESGIDFIAVDNPNANKLLVHIMAAVAEHERELISSRTKEALQAAKRRGVKLGEYGKNVLSKKNINVSREFALQMTPIIHRLQHKGYKTVRSLTKILNQKKIKTFAGNEAKWHINSVHRLLKKMELK